MKRLVVALCIAACNGDSGSTGNNGDDCTVDVQRVSCTDAMKANTQLQPFTAPVGKGAVAISVQGDDAIREGIPFDGSASSIADGWSVTFTSVIVTLDHFQLTDPDNVEPNKVVADARGPFAVDVVNTGDNKSVALTTLSTENLTCGTPALASKRYGFNYDVVPASSCAKNVNLSGAALSDYAEMMRAGYTVMFTGHAEFVGNQDGASCSEDGVDHSLWPLSIHFRFGTKQSLQNAACAGGLTVGGNAKAEVSLRSNLLFADKLADSGTSLYFDQIAAHFADGTSSSGLAHTEDFSSSSFQPFVTLTGDALTYRVCGSGSGAAGDAMTFDAKGANAANYGAYLEQALIKQLRYNGTGACEIRPPTPESVLSEEPLPNSPK